MAPQPYNDPAEANKVAKPGSATEKNTPVLVKQVPTKIPKVDIVAGEARNQAALKNSYKQADGPGPAPKTKMPGAALKGSSGEEISADVQNSGENDNKIDAVFSIPKPNALKQDSSNKNISTMNKQQIEKPDA